MRQLFEESSKMTVIPAKLAHRLNLPVWQRFVKAAETALSLGMSLIVIRVFCCCFLTSD
jgi:hypothetical protein